MRQMEQANENVGSRIITIYKNTWDSKNPVHITFEQALNRIQQGTRADLISEIRKTQDSNVRMELKKKLPAYNFTGKFKFRGNDGIEESSGLVCLDFDHIQNYSTFMNALKSDNYVCAAFCSPSGDGIKVIVKIPPFIQHFKKYFEALRMYFKMDDFEGWDDLKDIARLCYDSYDPNLYYNPNSQVFDITIKEKPIIKEYSNDGNKISDQLEVYRRVRSWADRTNSYRDGNKYKFLVYISSACNRFGLDMEFVIHKLIEDYQSLASHVDAQDFRNIVKRVYITYSNQHGNSHFTTEGEMNDFDPESPARDVIYLKDIREDMIQSYLKGDSKGETTYFNAIDPHWRWKRGEVNIMHGIPNHGKTTLMLQLMLIKSIKEGKKWGIFSPEQNPPIDFYKDLIHTYVGQSTEHYHKNQMDLKTFKDAMDWMAEHFFFVYPKDDKPTPRYINDRFEELIIKHNIDGCMTDPFNQLTNDWMSVGGRDDKYIEVYLAGEKRFSLDHNVYKIIVCHPRGSIDKVTERNQDDELMNAGNHQVPDQYDLAGGAMWSNKADNLLCTYQPYYISRIKKRGAIGSDGEFETLRHPSLVQFISQKIKKQKLIGRPGTAFLYFDVNTARYYEELDGFDPLNSSSSDPYRNRCSPFDKEYIHHESMVAPETKISETDWSAFKQTEEQEDKERNTKQEQQENKRLQEELGFNLNELDPTNFLGDDDYESYGAQGEDVSDIF